MMIQKLCKKRRGFSLIEVMVALAVLIFGLFAVLDLYLNSRTTLSNREAKQTAVGMARNIMEEIKALEHISISETAGLTSETTVFPERPRTIRTDNMTTSWQAEISLDKTDSTLIAITLKLDYSAGKQVQGTVVLHDIVMQ